MSLSVFEHISGTTRRVFATFSACYLWPWLGSAPDIRPRAVAPQTPDLSYSLEFKLFYPSIYPLSRQLLTGNLPPRTCAPRTYAPFFNRCPRQAYPLNVTGDRCPGARIPTFGDPRKARILKVTQQKAAWIQHQGCSGAETRWNAVPANTLEPERRSGKYRWPQVER